MTAANTSRELADQLITLSGKIYPAIDQIVDGETRAQRIMRLGMQAVASAAGTGKEYHTNAGIAYMSILHSELADGGIQLSDFNAWPRYQEVIAGLPAPQHPTAPRPLLDGLAICYSEVKRATIAADGSYETNASHVIHLSALALPYAAQHHPDLYLPTVGLYSYGHDMPEAYAGDVPSLGISHEAKRHKEKREAEALKRIGREVGREHPELIRALYDYENLKGDEAIYVKSFDKNEPHFTYITNGCLSVRRDMGIDSPEELRQLNQQTEDSMTYAQRFPDILAIRREVSERAILLAPWGEKIPA